MLFAFGPNSDHFGQTRESKSQQPNWKASMEETSQEHHEQYSAISTAKLSTISHHHHHRKD